MARPCVCERLPPPGQPYTTDYCRLCWLYHNRPDYREMWDRAGPAPGAVGASPTPPPRCPHLGRRARDAEGKVKKRWCETG
jgi:hypothetical protein